VLESAAFPYPDERLGEVVAVALVTAGMPVLIYGKLRFHCCALLADFQQPRKFFVMRNCRKTAWAN